MFTYLRHMFCSIFNAHYRYKIHKLKQKNKIMNQQNRLAMYRQWPPSPLDFGIGYKDGKLYDYLNKEIINEEQI